MKTTKHVLTALIFCSAILLNGCKKDDSDTHGETSHEPVITFISPVQAYVADEKDTLWIRVGISSADDLHEYKIEVKNLTTQAVAYSYDGHSHDQSVTTALYFLPDVDEDSDMQLTVTTLDHSGNSFSKSITFKINNTVEAVKPNITILSPDQEMYNNGDILSLKGSVSHSKALKEVKTELTRNGDVVFSYLPAIHGTDSVVFDTTYIIEALTHSDFEFKVTATDVDNHTAVKTHAFHVHP